MYGGNVHELKKYKSVKEECNAKEQSIRVDVPAFGGVLLEHKLRAKKGKE